MKAIILGTIAAGFLGFGASFIGASPAPASSAGGLCYYKCISSTPYYCCINVSGTACKPVTDGSFRCAQ